MAVWGTLIAASALNSSCVCPSTCSGACSGMVPVDSKVYVIGSSDSALTVQEVVLGSGAMATKVRIVTF